MTAAQACPALPSHGINFIHKDDTRRMTLGLVEQIAHTAGAYAHKHLDKLRARDGEERHASFTRNSFGQQCFTRSGRAYQQHTLGDARTQRNELLRLTQKLNHLFQFFFGLVHTSYVFECHSGLIAGEHAGPRFTKRHSSIIAALRLAEDKPKNAAQQQEGQNIPQGSCHPQPCAGGLDLNFYPLRRKVSRGYAQVEQLFNQRSTRVHVRRTLFVVFTAILIHHGQLAVVFNNTYYLAALDISSYLVDRERFLRSRV